MRRFGDEEDQEDAGDGGGHYRKHSRAEGPRSRAQIAQQIRRGEACHRPDAIDKAGRGRGGGAAEQRRRNGPKSGEKCVGTRDHREKQNGDRQ